MKTCIPNAGTRTILKGRNKSEQPCDSLDSLRMIAVLGAFAAGQVYSPMQDAVLRGGLVDSCERNL